MFTGIIEAMGDVVEQMPLPLQIRRPGIRLRVRQICAIVAAKIGGVVIGEKSGTPCTHCCRLADRPDRQSNAREFGIG